MFRGLNLASLLVVLAVAQGCAGVLDLPDGGLLIDPPNNPDGGTQPDAGTKPDGGVKPDGGTPPDAGSPPSIDGGTTGSPRYGINVVAALDYWGNRFFADAAKENRGFVQINTNTTPPTYVPTDADGWPMTDAYVVIYANFNRTEGTYTISFTGQATVAKSAGSFSISALQYDPASNTTRGTLTATGSVNTTMTLQFTNTQRTPGSATNTGITNLKVMRPLTEGSTTSYPETTTFTNEFKSSLAPFSVLRFMDYLATNANTDVNWSDRVGMTYATMDVPGSSNWEGRGGAFGYAFQLCNETAKDCWINIPFHATDDYVTQVATLAKSMLSPNLHLYVEFSNEVWNDGFQQTQDNHTLAIAEVNAGGSPLNFDGDTNNWDWTYRRYTKRSVEVSLIFRQVFGDAAMMTHVRPVLESQLGYADGPFLQEMLMLQSYYANPAYTSDPHPATYYFYGGGGSSYYSPDSNMMDSAADVLQSLDKNASWISAVQRDTQYLTAVGLKHLAYEGGAGLDSGDSSIMLAAHNDPQMQNITVDNQEAWEQNGGDLLVYFELTDAYQWGFMDDVFDQDTTPSNYKFLAVKQMETQPAQTKTFGHLLPTGATGNTLSGTSYDVPPSWAETGSNDIGPGKWYGWTVSAPGAGTYAVSLSAGCADGNGKIELWVDGALATTFSIKSTGSTSTGAATSAFNVQLSAGTHGLMLRGAQGTSTVGLEQLNVTQ